MLLDSQIREALQGTFRSAESLWGGSSPFKPGSTWLGYSANSEHSAYLDKALGNVQKAFTPKDPLYMMVAVLIRDMLPPAGRALFDTGYGDETIYVNPPAPSWTPSQLSITLATDYHDGNRKFTLFTGACGAAPDPTDPPVPQPIPPTKPPVPTTS